MNLKHLILVCVMLCSFSASAQLIQLSGIVAEDRTGYPLPFATVHVLGTYRGTVSSANGFFFTGGSSKRQYPFFFSGL